MSYKQVYMAKHHKLTLRNIIMNKQDLVRKFKKAYLSAHGSKCKDLTLNEWTLEQLQSGINALNSVIDKENE